MVPALTMCALQILLLPLLSGSLQLDRPLPVPTTEDVLQYDDGTAQWMCLDQIYRATWFHLDDFAPGSAGFTVQSAEFWFYHFVASYHSEWYSDYFGVELWNGDSAGPTELLASGTGVAAHYTACFFTFPEPVETGPDFWLVTILEPDNGTPSPLADSTPLPVNHSFSTNDFSIWTPMTSGDLFFRMHGNMLGLEETTWGAIKTLF